jgi:oligopeptidase B
VTITRHGETWTDEYQWLQDPDDPAVRAWLDGQNAYTDAAMAHTKALQDTLYTEMLGRILETDLSVPEARGGWLYYTRTETGKQYSIHCRRSGSMTAPEQVILDQNALAEGHAYFDLGGLTVSPDHRWLAYSVDLTGAESHRLHLRDLTTGQDLADEIPDVGSGLTWAMDSRTLFYTMLDETRRPYQLWRHVRGTSALDDVLVHHEGDAAFFVGIDRSRSNRWLYLSMGSHATSEVRLLEADRPTGGFRVVVPRVHGVEYGLEHQGDRFLIVTNDEAENFRLMEAPEATPGREHWREVIAHRPDVKLDGVDAFEQHLVIYERTDALRQIRIRRLSDGLEHYVPFPEPVYTVAPSRNADYETTAFRFVYTSLVTPRSVVDYHLDDRTWTLLKEQPVLGGYDRAQYTSERLWAMAPDGVRVPISLVYRNPKPTDGQRPCLLQGYGAYGYSFDPGFSSNTLSLLDRGLVVAIAHIRGGEEMGRRWYEDGKLGKKPNTFTDFIACAEHLVSAGYTGPSRLVINGGSAGGLLMGAVANLRPDLFAAVVAEVPFVDALNTMLDPSLPLTVIEYDEWGNPTDDPAAFRTIRSYAPYENVHATAYPNILATAGLNDPRVSYWEPAKWVARLRARRTNEARLLLKTNMGAGHGGASGRYDYLHEVAFKYAFMLDVLGAA